VHFHAESIVRTAKTPGQGKDDAERVQNDAFCPFR
jgi:hypothetical protein